MNELTAAEQLTLSNLETQISNVYGAYVTAARAVFQIHRDKLYRPHRSITDYCFVRFDFSPNDTSRYKTAGEVLDELGDLTELPTSESQCRALARFPKGKRKEAWESMLESGEKLTAKFISEFADETVEKNPTSEKTSKLKKLAHMIETVKEFEASKLDTEIVKKLQELMGTIKGMLPEAKERAA